MRHGEAQADPQTSPLCATFILLDDRAEAHYLCAVMNSSLVREYLYAAKPSGHVAPPSAIKPIAVPKFRRSSSAHRRLAALSEEAHKRVARGASVEDTDAEIDRLAESLWTTRS